MNPLKIQFLLLNFFFLFSLKSSSQSRQNQKFGEITIKDFQPKSNEFKSENEAAIILSKIGNTEFEGNNQGGFNQIYKCHTKILIKKASAFHLATVKIHLWEFSSTSTESIENIEAATYTLKNGTIEKTILGKKELLKEQVNRNYIIKKFTLPNVSENCIIEYAYTIKSPFDNSMHRWRFQDNYPTLWSEYKVTVPGIYNYSVKKNGILNKLEIDTSYPQFINYHINQDNNFGKTESMDIYGDAKVAIWAMKNVPAFVEQDFIANEMDNLSSYEFQLASVRVSNDRVINKIKNWFTIADELKKSEDFGEVVFDAEKNKWITDEIIKLTDTLYGLDAAKKMYTTFRDEFLCNHFDANKMSENPKKIFKEKKGNVADINLLLCAFLVKKGLKAEPVLLSTRGNGKPNETSAILSQYNYVICRLVYDSVEYYLDATNKKNGFGTIEPKCYNGYARCISSFPKLIDLSANNKNESVSTALFFVNTDKGFEASCTQNLGIEASRIARIEIEKSGLKSYLNSTKTRIGIVDKIENEQAEDLKDLDKNVTLKYDFKLKFEDDVVYFNPLLHFRKIENIFKAEKRLYKIEMPNTINETFVINMEIPNGYIVDEAPKSSKFLYNNSEGLFEYLLVNRKEEIQLKCRIILNKANFDVEDYEELRNFYAAVVQKQGEQIVFKKIKK